MSMRNQLPGQASRLDEEPLARFGNATAMRKQLPNQNVGPEIRDYSQALPTAVATDITAHINATDPHPDLIDDLTGTLSLALTDTLILSQNGTNRRCTLAELFNATFGHLVSPSSGSLTATGLAGRLGSGIVAATGALALSGKAATRTP